MFTCLSAGGQLHHYDRGLLFATPTKHTYSIRGEVFGNLLRRGRDQRNVYKAESTLNHPARTLSFAVKELGVRGQIWG